METVLHVVCSRTVRPSAPYKSTRCDKIYLKIINNNEDLPSTVTTVLLPLCSCISPYNKRFRKVYHSASTFVAVATRRNISASYNCCRWYVFHTWSPISVTFSLILHMPYLQLQKQYNSSSFIAFSPSPHTLPLPFHSVLQHQNEQNSFLQKPLRQL